MVKNNHSNSFLIFEESEHFFVYNGGNGDLIEISEIYYDVLKYSSIYDINNTSDVDDLIFLFQKKYSQNQLKTVIDDLVNNFYFSKSLFVFIKYPLEYIISTKSFMISTY